LITGPIQLPRRVGSPTGVSSASLASRATSSSIAGLSTSTREVAEHFCPCRPKAERWMPMAARSRSACLVTMTGFLPPISAMHGRGQRPWAKARTIPIPTSPEPVKVTPATSGCRTSASPTSGPLPVT
jgi:hypothetical protein